MTEDEMRTVKATYNELYGRTYVLTSFIELMSLELLGPELSIALLDRIPIPTVDNADTDTEGALNFEAGATRTHDRLRRFFEGGLGG